MRIPERYATIERLAMPLDDFDEAEIVETEHPFNTEGAPLHIRIDAVPQDTIAVSPDNAAAMAIAMQKLSASGKHQLGFKVEYFST